jgi:sugar phosphate isomerase/epimerase
VQLSDVKRVTLRTMDRALLGKGILPLRAIMRALEARGCRGWYEAEIISDDLERIGYERARRHTRAAFLRLLPRRASHGSIAAIRRMA